MIYFPNACIVCNTTTGLKRCNCCQMITYCSSLHQKKDWPEHKYVCGIISTMMKERGVSHLFENLRGVDLDTWLNERMKMMKEAETRVRRSFEFRDKFLFKFPRFCFVCHESRQILLRKCPGCPNASFCKEHPNSPIHDKDCLKIKECFEFGTQFLEPLMKFKNEILLPKNKTQFVLKSFKPSEQPVSTQDFLLNFYNRTSLTICENMKLHLSQMYSRILTVFSALQKLELSSVPILTIFVQDMIDSEGCETLLHLLPELKILKIVVLDPSNPFLVNYKQLNLCPECTKWGKKIFVRFVMHPLQVFVNGVVEEPDLVVSYDINSTGYDFFDEKVTRYLKASYELNCPVIMTTCTEREHGELKKSIKLALGNIELFFDDLNPFSSLLCKRNYYDGRVGFSNNYMIILKSKHLKQKCLKVESAQMREVKESTERNELNSIFLKLKLQKRNL